MRGGWHELRGSDALKMSGEVECGGRMINTNIPDRATSKAAPDAMK